MLSSRVTRSAKDVDYNSYSAH